MNLTDSQKRDLLNLYEIHCRTIGTYDYPNGKAVSLRCGKTLEKLGLVEWGNRYSVNRYKRWRITEKGIKVAEELISSLP
jgi:hypothetical protein